MLPGKLGYVSLSQFGQTAVEEVEGALKELESQGMRALVFDLQRYLAKAMYMIQSPGAATGFTMAWPALGNFRVWQGGRPHERLWVDDTKAPIAKT